MTVVNLQYRDGLYVNPTLTLATPGPRPGSQPAYSGLNAANTSTSGGKTVRGLAYASTVPPQRNQDRPNVASTLTGPSSGSGRKSPRDSALPARRGRKPTGIPSVLPVPLATEVGSGKRVFGRVTLPPAAVLELIKEKDFQAAVIDLARLFGWRPFWTWRSINSPEGEPDLRLVRPPRVIFAELKTEKGRLTAFQRSAGELLMLCPGIEYYLFRPRDWNEIVEVLA